MSATDLLSGLNIKPGELDWAADALCAQTDPEAFYPEKGGSVKEAKKVCESCPVREACLVWAMARDEKHGVWGGLTERERRARRKKEGRRSAGVARPTVLSTNHEAVQTRQRRAAKKAVAA